MFAELFFDFILIRSVTVFGTSVCRDCNIFNNLTRISKLLRLCNLDEGPLGTDRLIGETVVTGGGSEVTSVGLEMPSETAGSVGVFSQSSLLQKSILRPLRGSQRHFRRQAHLRELPGPKMTSRLPEHTNAK